MYLIKCVLQFIALGITCHAVKCPAYIDYSKELHRPFSTGKFKLAYQRPTPACRTFNSTAVENVITSYRSKIKDPDLYRLFENSFPSTLDTAIAWHGNAAGRQDEELTFVITGDINAMWLRDSANQMQSYLSLLKPSAQRNSLASLYRGVINLQSRFLMINPFCNSFQPPAESGIKPSENDAASNDDVKPKFNNQTVFECKYELDSLGAFLEVSTNYFNRTSDSAFFSKFQWLAALRKVLDTADSMTIGTYAADGRVNKSPYTFQRETTSGTETLANSGIGNPTQEGTGLVRSAFRPSDDATLYQLFIPANMLFVAKLEQASSTVAKLPSQKALYNRMLNMAKNIRSAITKHGVITDASWGRAYAFEVDGFGGRNLMDDANIPSLLSAPMFGYTSTNDPVYQTTRRAILSTKNPYYMRGPVINSVGGPHQGPGYAWPMAKIVQIMTSRCNGFFRRE